MILTAGIETEGAQIFTESSVRKKQGSEGEKGGIKQYLIHVSEPIYLQGRK